MFSVGTIFGRKHVSREQAVVLDVRDPDMLGRIMVISPTLGETGWITYVMAPGMYDPPKVGDKVYVEVENGEISYPISHGKIINPLYDKAQYPNSLFREVPTITALISNGFLGADGKPVNSFGANGFTGNAIILDDGMQSYGSTGVTGNQYAGIKILSYGGAKVMLSDEAHNQKILIADFNNKSTPIQLDTSTGNFFLIDSEADKITIQDISGNSITLTPQGIVINSASKCTINSSGDTIVNAGGKCSVTATAINLNGQDGMVLTTQTDPVIDEIFGTPTEGVETVTAG